MAHTAAMNDELFRALRDDAGMPEAAAAKVARLIFQQGESAVRAGREAERAADRDAFAAKGDVTVLQAKAENTDSAIERIDKTLLRMDERFDRMDERLSRLEKIVARLDERMNSLESQNRLIFRLLLGIFVPLHLLTLGALIGLLTRGILWGVAP